MSNDPSALLAAAARAVSRTPAYRHSGLAEGLGNAISRRAKTLNKLAHAIRWRGAPNGEAGFECRNGSPLQIEDRYGDRRMANLCLLRSRRIAVGR